MTRHRDSKLLFASLVACALAAAPAFAQADYPNRAIRIIVPIPPGPTADVLPRIIAEKLAAKWGQPVIVENRPGATANLGAEAVARAEPDGYTLLATPQGPLVINQHIGMKLGYEPTAFVPVTVMGALPSTLVAHPSLPVSTLSQLIAYAKANPDKITYATSGIGSPQHLATMMLESAAGIRMVHVPYRGMAPAMTDVLAGHVHLMFDNLGNTRDHIKDNRLKLLAVTTERRVPQFPDTPAIAEMFPGVLYTSWFALVAPPKTPPAIAVKLQAAVAEALQMPDVVRRLAAMSVSPGGMSPLETTALIKDESERWRKIIQATGVRSD